MLGVAWYEHYSVEVSVGQHSGPCNLAAVIDRLAIGHRKRRAGGNKIIEVDNRSAGPPDEAVALEFASAVTRCARNFTSRIYEMHDTACVVLDGSQICHQSVLPKESVKFLVATGR